jgi:hypothetical protein
VTVKYVFGPPVAWKKYFAGITLRVIVFVPVPETALSLIAL